jgi:hypothetical protein
MSLPPALMKLSDSEITALMALSRPLDPKLRIVFMEQMASRLDGHAVAGDGLISRLAREVQRALYAPPLETEEREGGRRKLGKYA